MTKRTRNPGGGDLKEVSVPGDPSASDMASMCDPGSVQHEMRDHASHKTAIYKVVAHDAPSVTLSVFKWRHSH